MDGAEEKIASLKKAYADVLLNTAKESAARILASENKVALLQRNLAITKEEALGMLLRMKSIMNAKMNEVDNISHSQKRRICELESQLSEAEHTIAFLKAELKRVNVERENMKSTPSEVLGIKETDHGTCIEDVCKDKPILMRCYIGSGNPDVVPTSDLKNFNDRSQTSGDHCCNSHEDSSKIKSAQKSYPENNSSGNHNLASLIMIREEPELYRNGCTQRIRALEQNVVTGNGQISRNFPKFSEVCKNEKPLNPYISVSCMGNNVVDCFSKPNTMEKKIGNYKTDQNGNLEYRYSSKKPRSGSKRTTDASALNKETADHEASPGHLKDEIHKTDINTSCTYLCSETMNEIEKDSTSVANSCFSYVIPAAESNKEQIVSSSGLNSRISDVPNCKMGLEKTDARLEGSDAKVANGAPTQVTSERHLKYTFQRKRMKRSSTDTTEENCLDKKNNLKRKISDKTDVEVEPQKPNQIVESSRESRRIAQVARQLISLSEKRW